jgi:sarcosine oxidase
MTSTDIVVIGLGVHGSACAYWLAARGFRVIGLERSPRNSVAGASRGPMRMARTSDPHQPQLTPLALESIELWQGLFETQRKTLIQRVPGVFVRRTLLRDSAHTDQERLQRLPADDPLLADIALQAGWEALLDDACWLFDASACVLGLREKAQAAGATLLFGHAAELPGLRPSDGLPVRVRAGGKEITAGTVLVCVGAWVMELPRWAQIPGLRVEQAHMQIATFSKHSDFPARNAFYVFYDQADRFCVIPMGESLQFGHFAASPTAGRLSSPSVATVTGRHDIATLMRHIKGLGQIQDRLTVSGAYTTPPDGSFVLRWVSSRVATLTACSGVGFKFAPAVASRVVAAMERRTMPQEGLRVEGGA